MRFRHPSTLLPAKAREVLPQESTWNLRRSILQLESFARYRITKCQTARYFTIKTTSEKSFFGKEWVSSCSLRLSVAYISHLNRAESIILSILCAESKSSRCHPAYPAHFSHLTAVYWMLVSNICVFDQHLVFEYWNSNVISVRLCEFMLFFTLNNVLCWRFSILLSYF